jgi:hypothetical protein
MDNSAGNMEGNRYNIGVNIAFILGVRLCLGLFIASAMAITGYLLGWFVAPRDMLAFLALILVLGSGVGASFGSIISWAGLQDNRRLLMLTVVLAIPGAFLGAWGGYAYGHAVYGGEVVPKSATALSTVLAATFVSNAVLFLVNCIWYLRHKNL